MSLLPAHIIPPRRVVLPGFALAVLSPAHAEWDHAAVTASADTNRHVFGPDNGWPTRGLATHHPTPGRQRHGMPSGAPG